MSSDITYCDECGEPVPKITREGGTGEILCSQCWEKYQKKVKE